VSPVTFFVLGYMPMSLNLDIRFISESPESRKALSLMCAQALDYGACDVKVVVTQDGREYSIPLTLGAHSVTDEDGAMTAVKFEAVEVCPLGSGFSHLGYNAANPLNDQSDGKGRYIPPTRTQAPKGNAYNEEAGVREEEEV